MFVEHKLNYVSLKFTNPFRQTAGSRRRIRKNGGFRLMPLEIQQYMSILFHIIQERCNSDAFIGQVRRCESNG